MLGAAPPSPELLREAQTLLDQGDTANAIVKYEEARSIDPESPQLAYNLGVAKYRAGELTEAARLFREAAAGASSQATTRSAAQTSLAAQSMFNQGTAVYADALKQLPTGGPPAGEDAAASLQEAISAVEKSLTHFRDAANADPADHDSRANAERAWRLLKKLKGEQQKQQENEQQQDQEQDPQQEKQQDQQQDQQQSKDQQDPQNGDQKPQQQGDGQDQKQEQPKDQPGDEPPPGEQKPEQPQDGQEDQSQQPKQAQGEAQGQGQGPGKQQREAISPADAERILQMVRDKEKQRRAQLLRQQRAKQQPVPKDW